MFPSWRRGCDDPLRDRRARGCVSCGNDHLRLLPIWSVDVAEMTKESRATILRIHVSHGHMPLQAVRRRWSLDPRFEDGCERNSAVMIPRHQETGTR